MSNLARSLFIGPAVALAFTTAVLAADVIDWPAPGRNDMPTVADGPRIDWPAPGTRLAAHGTSGGRAGDIDWPTVTVRT
ncbi:hypothetical protein [Streptomyces sp. NPDC006670]|uniref:hypothetical protein n=1 Tax=unclassified Streptomyces TaxID=2593676 RepID=UPI0033CB3FBD